MTSLVAQMVKNLPAMWRPRFSPWVGKIPWRRTWQPTPLFPGESPWTEEPGGLQSMGSWRVGHNWATSLSLFTFMHWKSKWQPTPVFLSEYPRDGGAWWAAIYGFAQSRTRLKWLSSSSSMEQNKDNWFLIKWHDFSHAWDAWFKFTFPLSYHR